MILTVLTITFIVAFIIDYSGIVKSLQKLVNIILYKGKADPGQISLKPFTCSLCMSFWTVLIYGLCLLGWSAWIEVFALAALSGFAASFISQFLFTFRHLWQQFLAWVVKLTS